ATPLLVIWNWPHAHESAIEEGTSGAFLAIGIVLLWASVRKCLGLQAPIAWIGGACTMFFIWVTAVQAGWIPYPLYFGIAALQVETARLLWLEGRKHESTAEPMLVTAFVIWAMAFLAAWFQLPVAGRFRPEMLLII